MPAEYTVSCFHCGAKVPVSEMQTHGWQLGHYRRGSEVVHPRVHLCPRCAGLVADRTVQQRAGGAA